MDLNRIYSSKRTGQNTEQEHSRSIYRRDYDRIIFSSAFRRLQNKTQVFPLPGSIFVHNRLTHSLEVASVGRSLGAITGEYIASKYQADLTSQSREFYLHDLQDVIASACLCHDIGNPSFGHSGEDAIAEYFREKERDTAFKSNFSDAHWADLTNFEGNANAIRCLTAKQSGKESGGLGLTYSTLAAIMKYPCASTAIDKKIIHRKKFGYLQADRNAFLEIVAETEMKADSTAVAQSPENHADVYYRHPFVWLVEAADDICYNIIDMEDAHRLRIIEHNECVDVFLQLLKETENDKIKKIEDRLTAIEDKNSQISYLRAKSISYLIYRAGELFKENFCKILSGTLDIAIYDLIKKNNAALSYIGKFSVENIYNHRSVVEIENAGYNVMRELLKHFIPPVLKSEYQRSKMEDKAVKLIPRQFLFDTESPYMKALGVIDYISGMTDNYAVDLYKRIKGIDMGMNSGSMSFSK
ncbi:MAG: dNTP triphosphohydrolase [Prevotellaceae bacterium]|jgi:dGTPase|nr:dNTP triphosphohydrolase [Prevotellaceae bacterium]